MYPKTIAHHMGRGRRNNAFNGFDGHVVFLFGGRLVYDPFTKPEKFIQKLIDVFLE